MNAGANTYLPRSVALTASGVTFFARHGQCRSNTEWPITDYHDLIDPLTELGKRRPETAVGSLQDSCRRPPGGFTRRPSGARSRRPKSSRTRLIPFL